MKLAIFILLLMLFRPLHANAEDNYCIDQESWKQWDVLIQKYPDDTDIQTLHALRLGLCAKVQRGDLTIQQATTIFETARGKIVDKKRHEMEKGPDI